MAASWEGISTPDCWPTSLLQLIPDGERGEFHTFCYAGPMSSGPIPVRVGEKVVRDGFYFADLLIA